MKLNGYKKIEKRNFASEYEKRTYQVQLLVNHMQIRQITNTKMNRALLRHQQHTRVATV